MVLDCEDPDGTSRSSSILNLINAADGPLVQCKAELHSLERILEHENWPPKGTELTNTVNNLKRILAILDANDGLTLDSQSNVSTEPTSTSLPKVRQDGINDMRDNVTSMYRLTSSDFVVGTKQTFTADYVDARYGTHHNAGGDQYIYYAPLKDNVTGKCNTVSRGSFII